MQFIVRITILGVFAAAGVALAISVAANTHVAPIALVPQDTGDEIGEPRVKKVAVSDVPVLPPAPTASVGPQVPPAAPQFEQMATFPVAAPVVSQPPLTAPPLLAEYEPKFANQLDSVLEAIGRFQTKQTETADAVTRLQEQMPAQPPAQSTPTEILPPTSTTNSGQVQLTPGSDLIDIDAQDSDIRYVLKLLSKAGGLNILASPNVSGNVSASLQNVPIEIALRALLKSTGFVYVREADIIYVGTPEDLRGMAHVAELVTSRIYRPNYVNATELQKLITPLHSSDVGQVTISSPPEIGIASNATDAGGDKFSGGDVVMVRDYVTILAEIDQVVAEVEALETIGDTTVVVLPRVMCLNKQRAEILIGSELGYVSTTVTETAATQGYPWRPDVESENLPYSVRVESP